MTKDQLLELGLTEDTAEGVLKLAQAAGETAAQKQEQALATTQAELASLKNQLGEANKQIEGFKSMDIEGIRKAAEDYKAKFEAGEKQHKADMEALQFDYALSDSLKGAKARNVKSVKALLDMEGLKLSGGEIIGLKEQLEKIKTDNGFLFEDDTPPPRVLGAAQTLKTNGAPKSYSEAVQFLQNNPGAKL